MIRSLNGFARSLVLSLACIALIGSAAQASLITLPPDSSSFSGNVRGFWFTAPVDFKIVGVGVPLDENSGPQTIEILRLNAPPPVFSGTTNDFTSLYRVVGDTSLGLISVDITVHAGDIIGVLGYRNSVNSYGTNHFASSILGQPVTLERFGMQANLNDGPAHNVWQEPDASFIGRVLLDVEPLTAPVPEPTSIVAFSLLACAGMFVRRRNKTI